MNFTRFFVTAGIALIGLHVADTFFADGNYLLTGIIEGWALTAMYVVGASEK